MKKVIRLFTIAVALTVGSLAHAQGKGEGAIVIRDTAKDGLAPIYRSEEGDKLEAKAERGDFVAGVTTFGLARQYQFERKPNGRVHVLYFPNTEQRGMPTTAWMDEKDLAFFTYYCGCAFKGDTDPCSPLALYGFMSRTWNTCFKEGRDAKAAELQAKSSTSGGQSTASRTESKPEKALTNEDILSLIKVGIGDEIIVAKINQTTTTNLDTSTDALIRLKNAGASQVVLNAIMNRASSMAPKKQ